jgi:ELWxxDGT repeat protein
MVKDINPGPGDGVSSISYYLPTVGDVVFFEAYHPATGTDLWKSDGTAAGTTIVKDFAASYEFNSLQPIIAVDDVVYFFVKDYDANKLELWQTNGTEPGTLMLKTIDALYMDVYNFHVLDNLVIFTIEHDDTRDELWRSDGTVAGTYMVKAFDSGDPSARLWNFVPTAEFLYFTADDGANGNELWRTNGTEAGTFMIANINPGADSSDPENLVSAAIAQQESAIFFRADDGQHGKELWYSDGTEINTFMIYNINPGPADSHPGELTNVTLSQQGIWLFFAADDGQNGYELWALPHTSFTDHGYLPLLSK